MHWSCNDCGACCIGMHVPARATGDYASGADGYAVNLALKKKRLPLIDHDGMMPRKNEACVALDVDAARCTIYDNRPWVCQAFTQGSPMCVTSRLLKGVDTVDDPVKTLRWRGSDREHGFPVQLATAFATYFRARGMLSDASRLEGWILEDAKRQSAKSELRMPDMRDSSHEESKAIPEIFVQMPKAKKAKKR